MASFSPLEQSPVVFPFCNVKGSHPVQEAWKNKINETKTTSVDQEKKQDGPRGTSNKKKINSGEKKEGLNRKLYKLLDLARYVVIKALFLHSPITKPA
jgi:hypothetical protein